MATPLHLLLVLAAIVTAATPSCVAAAASSAASTAEHILGVNYGTLGDNLPLPQRGLELARSAGASAVRFYDANATMLAAAAASGLEFVPSVPNELIPSLAASQRAADAWVATTLLPFRGNPRLRYLFVGNEVLSDPTARSRWPRLVPAMANVHRALHRHGLGSVKVSTTFSMHELEGQNVFRRPPARSGPTSPVPSYTNLLDQMLDAVVAAMCRAGHCGVGLALAETGWPTAGDLDQFGANVRNAATYNRNLARHLASGAGTPRRPRARVAPAMVFALFNEDLKWGPGTERHWGLFYPNGSAVYEVDLTGRRRSLPSYPPLPPASNDRPYPGPLWCVVATDKGPVNETAVRAQVAAACADVPGLCDPVRPGGACFLPDTVSAHASFVFSAHWNRFSEDYGGCYFAGFAVETTVDPSHGSCKFPSILLK